jgi:hypothetical protein
VCKNTIDRKRRPVAKQPKGELVVVGFNYGLLDTKVADKVRSSADRIREKVRKALGGLIEIGKDLQTVKEALPHGQFTPWLKAEFGWSERTAQNFMSVAERFGPKTEIIADLTIQPTAAYLLAAPSVPDEARVKAIERAQAGEQITTALARKILAESRKTKKKALPADKLGGRLARVLERYRDRWAPGALSELARQLRTFADTLEGAQRGGRKMKKE